MHLLPCGHDTKVLAEGATETEVQGLSAGVGDDTASLLDEDGSRGVVLGRALAIRKDNTTVRAYPDLLLVTGANWHAEIDSAVAARQGAILGLAVHARGRACDSEELGDTVVERKLRVCLLHAFQQVQLVLREGRDRESDWRRCVRGGERELPCTLATSGDEEAPARAGWI